MIPTEYYRTIRRNPFLVCYWRLNDEGSEALDSAGRFNLNGIYNGSPAIGQSLITPAAGETGGYTPRSRKFGGEKQNVEIPDAVPLRIVGNITIEAWLSVKEFSVSLGNIFSKQSSAGFPEPYVFEVHEKYLEFRLGNGSVDETILTEQKFEIGIPIHVAATRFEKEMKIIANGKVVATGNLGSHEVKDGGKPVYIGESGENSFRFNSLISEVALYNAALSPRTLRQHYEIGRHSLPNPGYYTTFNEPTYS